MSSPKPRSPRTTTEPTRLRADAVRNRERVLVEARAAFAEHGASVPLDEIARRAGVGPGTVYRHFPTKESLFEAIVIGLIEQLIEEAHALREADDAGAAFYRFFARIVEEAEANRGLADALAEVGFDRAAAVSKRDDALRDAITGLLVRSQRAGATRLDLDAAEVQALAVGAVTARRQRGNRRSAEHLVMLICDGLRARR